MTESITTISVESVDEVIEGMELQFAGVPDILDVLGVEFSPDETSPAHLTSSTTGNGQDK